MGCKNKLCDKYIISSGVTFNGTSLVINLPAGSYYKDKRYCIVVAQNIPSTATINAPVVITIGSSSTQYPLVMPCCEPVTACRIGSRSKYPVVCETTPSSAVFRLTETPCCVDRDLVSVNGTVAATSES